MYIQTNGDPVLWDTFKSLCGAIAANASVMELKRYAVYNVLVRVQLEPSQLFCSMTNTVSNNLTDKIERLHLNWGLTVVNYTVYDRKLRKPELILQLGMRYHNFLNFARESLES